jgi:hypothetical protein
MSDKHRPSNEDLTLENMGQAVLATLSDYYVSSNPENKAENFIPGILNPIEQNENATGENILQDFKNRIEAGTPTNLQYASMLIGCAYCMQSSRALLKKEREHAWYYMAEARYWCGVMLASTGIEEASKNAFKAARKHIPQKGGKARAELLYRDIKEVTFKLAREKYPPGRGWKSRREAALAIKEEVVEYSKTELEPLSPDQAFDTIYGWLAKMPDAASLFPKKNNKART